MLLFGVGFSYRELLMGRIPNTQLEQNEDFGSLGKAYKVEE